MRHVHRPLLAISLVVLIAVSLSASPASAQTQAWPTRTVRFILTLGPGSGTDIGGRLLADRLTKKWGQSVVIENKPGGDSIVEINAFVSAKDDHILLLSPTSAFTAHPFLHDNLPYKPEDLTPIARVSNTFVGITVPTPSPANSLTELIALVRDKPGELNWAGVTGATRSCSRPGSKATSSTCGRCPTATPSMRAETSPRTACRPTSRRLRSPSRRSNSARSSSWRCSIRCGRRLIPTFRRSPRPDTQDSPSTDWSACSAIPFMPMELRERIAADIKEVMEGDPIVKDRLTRTGQLFNPGGPAEFGASIESQRATVTAAANALGMYAKQ